MATDYNSKYSGEQVEALLDQVASGNAGGGGGGGIAVETDPVFLASPAASITDEKIAEWDNKYAKPSGGIPQSDLAEEVKGALRKAEQYKGTVTGVQINNSTKMPTDGIVNIGLVGTYDKPSTGIPKTDLDNDVQNALGKAENAVSKEKVGDMDVFPTQGFYGQSNGAVYALPNEATGDEDDILLSRDSVKTINGESILGSGNIEISGGSGEVGPQGPQGDKGDKGDTGVGVQSVTQTTTSNADGGSNVVTVTLTDGTKSTFTVKNGSKGSQGIQGEQGPKGDTGATGATGAQGPKGDKGDKGDTGATGANGTNGVSVSSVKQTTTSTADGGTNVVTVTLSNGTTSTFNVKNGSKGSNGTNGTNGKDGADGADGATFTPSVDSAGNLSWTNNKGLTNPPTVNIKGPKGDAGEGGGTSGGGGKEVIVPEVSRIDELEGNKIYVLNFTTEALIIGSFSSNTDAYETYDIIFKTVEFLLGGGFYLVLPESVIWANGIIPTIEVDTVYELSIVRTTIDSIDNYSAVLTPFKPV